MDKHSTLNRQTRLRRQLMRSASVFAIVVALSHAPAKSQTLSVLHGAVVSNNAAVIQRFPTGQVPVGPGKGENNPSSSAHMLGAQMRQLQYQSRVTQAMTMAKDAQAAARAAAASLQPNVPDGLAPGGLVPVPDPVQSAQDTTGLHTWEGADQPVQETEDNGRTKVTVKQTQARAVLSWETFNVGQKTDLTFDQSQDGVDQSSWVALNRVVGQLDPNTGLRDPNATPAPSQILGTIHAPGTVLVINQNGVIFGGTSQINTNALIATSLEVGRAIDVPTRTRLNIQQRNEEFLNFGFLGFADQASSQELNSAYTFSAQANLDGTGFESNLEGRIEVQAGAQITSGVGGYVLLTGPKVINAGTISSTAGEVALQSGRTLKLTRSTGSAGSNPDVRGFTLSSTDGTNPADHDYVLNTGLIETPQGYLSLGATDFGAVMQQGVLAATTSVSRNGFIQITGGDIQIAPGSTIAIRPDDGKQTIPQDPESLGDFRVSKISIGTESSRVEVGKDSMIYAPGGDVGIGVPPGQDSPIDRDAPGSSRIFIDTGAIIDVAGLTDVLIPASRNAILISPVKGNELRDDPNYRDSFLNGATVLVDPRLSGINENGVAWVGSPLIEAKSFAQQVGVKVEELMTKGGNVSLGVRSHTVGVDPTLASDITVKAGAVIDVSGGWVTYEGGRVVTTELITVNGQIIDIGSADINGGYIGIKTGFRRDQARWGVSETWTNPLLEGSHYETTYSEGRDAGSLTLKASAIVLDGTMYGDAYAGPRQLADSHVGTASSSVFGDFRHMQGAPSQLPSSGFLFIQGLTGETDQVATIQGAGDIQIVSQQNYHAVDPSLGYGQSVSLDANGNLVVPTERDPNSFLPTDRQQVISISADAVSSFGLSAMTLETSGKISVAADANVSLQAGGIFNAVAGRAITVDGSVNVASGLIQMQTVNAGQGSVFTPDDPGPGSFDITVNGTLSTRGRWVNDDGADSDHLQGSAFTDGGSVVLIGAPRQSQFNQVEHQGDDLPENNVDISGSILLNDTSVIDVSGGGYVNTRGKLSLNSKGGNLSLVEETTYFQLGRETDNTNPGGIPGFRITGYSLGGGGEVFAVNPDEITAKVTLDGTILANGFSGGGTFTLVTPEFRLDDGAGGAGTHMGLDFFSKSGFGNFDIASYKTELDPNTFDNGLGGFNAILATQTVTIGEGQTLNLTQSMFSNVLGLDQINTLRGLESGGDLYSVLTPGVPDNDWDARAVNLNLGGLIELDVAEGGTITGAAGSAITASKILNEGHIRIAGGTLTQSEALPTIYADGRTALGVHDLSEVFSVNEDGTIHEDDPNAKGLKDTSGNLLSNRDVAAQFAIYRLGRLETDQGIVLAEGSVTDLSGAAIVNPRATSPVQGFQNGRLVDGGTLQTAAALHTTDLTFASPIGVSIYYGLENPLLVVMPETLTAEAGSLIDISGVSTDAFFRPGRDGTPVPTALWSNGGTLAMSNGGTLTGATIKAQGGSEHAMGGTLVIADPTLVQNAGEDHTGGNIIAADQIEQSGFETFVAEGSLNTDGAVALDLGRAFFLVSRPYDGQADLSDPATRDRFAPVVHLGGDLEIDAPYIRFSSALQTVSTPLKGDPAGHTATFHAGEIDISGAVLFDQSVADLKLVADNDIRLSGVDTWQRVFNIDPEAVDPSLIGQLAVNGNLDITAGQVFPTTGSTFYVTSAAEGGTITFAKSGGATPATPYSAGGDLTVQAANIVQGGVIRVPIGHLQLGGNDPLQIANNGVTAEFAPATESLEALDGSITSVSADGMIIPYGTTTDQIEWFFAATGADELTAPPEAVLDMAGTNVKIDEGATVDLSGGGDLFAYEFISGVGGSHDVLDRFNADPFSSNNGCQFPDCRQVYAIVPSLEQGDPTAFDGGQAALYDPIYSSQYGDLYSAQAAGKQVYLDKVPGLAPGWYTLLPAKYATLPGGMRVVENTGAASVLPATYVRQRDGSYIVTGYYGTAGTDNYDSTLRQFNVQTQRVFNKYSNIALTSATAKFALEAAHDGKDAPPLPIDSGRLVLAPEETLTIDAELKADPAKGGRGAEVDISGDAFAIVSDLGSGQGGGAILLSADQLTNLHAASLLIGGERTDNDDGTTSLAITARSITVGNDAAHPLDAPEIVLAVDGDGANITVADGAVIRSSGTLTRARSGDYVIDGGSDDMTGQGAVLRVAQGPQRLVTRETSGGAASGRLDIGAADLEGEAILLESSGDLTASPDLTLKTDVLALGAGQVTFTSDPTGLSGLVITPELQALIADIGELTIRTPGAIDFSSGTYTFNDLTLDTPGLALKDGGGVTIDADKLTIGNSGDEQAACGGDGGIACGSGALTIDAAEIAFASGTVRTYGFGGTATLAATTGIFAQGDSVFDAGPAALLLRTPFIGDRIFPVAPGETQEIASLSLTTTGAVDISNPGGAAAGTFASSPGATIAISGNSVDITGTTIRATAGTLDIKSDTSITVGGGATLATPGFEKNFGDAADPYIVSAPGGLVHLTALDGDIDLQEGSLVSVGGGSGTAGTVQFSAAKGDVIFDGTLDAKARGGGGSFVLDQLGGFDLSSFETDFGGQFNGTIAIRTATGDLVLNSDAALKAGTVMLTADGGSVDIFGLIDVSGVFGGDVSLFGLDGVTLHAGSTIDAHAEGYSGKHDTRQARGGNVEIGTDGDGVITVENGALIDVSATRGDRMVPIVHNGSTYYLYVPADLGGTVDFRAPIIEDGEGRTVNVFYNGGADGIVGARDVAVQAFERFDLAEIAADPNFVGVTINEDGQAVLDVGADGGINWLGDMAPGTLVDFVQNFALDGDTDRLGALDEMANYHARPGMELDYDGDIVLASNWNLGAGVVDTDRALADGLMFEEPNSKKLYVVAGKEQELFSNYTTMLYRTDHGSVDGEAGVLTLRAGGDLDLKGSITDGFFQFHDQTDPEYLDRQLGGGDKEYEAYLNSGCRGDCNMIGAWQTTDGSLPTNYLFITVPGANDLQSFLFNPAPYSAEANAADAKGSIGNKGSGDPLGSMQLFPLIQHAPDGPQTVAVSFTYQLVSGADLSSVDPMRTAPGSTANLIVEGEQTYTYAGDKTTAKSEFGKQLFMFVGGDFVTPEQWYDAILGSAGASADSFTFIDFGSAPGAFKDFLTSQVPVYFAGHPDEFQIITKGGKVSGVTTTLELAAGYLTDVIAESFPTFRDDYKAPKPKVYSDATTAHTRTLVRTGVGDIWMAAAGDIDLTNGDPVYRTLAGKNSNFENGLQVGGTSVYTAGHTVDPTPFTITDELTGLDFEIDPTPFDTRQDFFDHPPDYRYGAGGDANVRGTGLSGVLIADPVFTDGGGDVSMVAGGDVKGRRDEWSEVRLATDYDKFKDAGYLWMGPANQPWRSGAIGNASVAMINPQLFWEGVGALGGGTVSISAGRDVSDLTIADDTSIVTANVRQGGFTQTLSLLTFGGGNVFVDAGRDILGGRFDVASGLASFIAGRDIASAGLIKIADSDNPSSFKQNTARLRLTDAFVSFTAMGDIDLQGVTALGIAGASSEINPNLNAHGFYSETAGVSLLADGSVTIENRGADVLTEDDSATQNTPTAVYPGTLEAVAMTGDLDIATGVGLARSVFTMPAPEGELVLVSGANILPTIIAQDDGDRGLLPGIFTIFDGSAQGVISGRTFLFPGILPNTSIVERQMLHNSSPTHQGDPVPNRIYSGGDIVDMILAVAKQTRIGAARDLVNMMFFGQNLAQADITRIVAGRDITATTKLVEPFLKDGGIGEPEAAVQGNTFVIGGPGSFFLEAGRDAGPFLNSAVTDGLASTVSNDVPTGRLVYAGGIISVGNEWNPWLDAKGADLFVEFGVGKGQAFDALRDYYLNPENLGNLDGDLFEQVKDEDGNLIPDRDKPIYAPVLIKWLQQHQEVLLEQLYGTTDIDFQQAYDAFKTLPELTQRVFLTGSVYFNELLQTSIPDGPSFKQYSRGYQAVNLLFPSELGYTKNDLSGGSNGANETIETGNLDLRLATIQTSRGGNIYLVGPGGRVLAGSTVRTSEQAARRTYDGGRLFLGNPAFVPRPAEIVQIPIGFEGILTLRGGSIYTFTDLDFLLNQSRLFTEQGGDIAMWSSNGNLNAGQGPKTSANFPPVVVKVDQDLVSEVDSAGGVSGAGIAAFEPAPGVAAPDVFLIAPRGTVDAGDAGVRVAGNLFIAAQTVANSENFSVGGTSSGIPSDTAVDVSAQTAGSTAAAAAEQQAENLAGNRAVSTPASIITVELLGISGDENNNEDEEERKKKKKSS